MPANKVYYVALFPHIFMAKCTLEMRHAAMTLGAGAVAQLQGTLMERSEPPPLDERVQYQLYGKRRLLDYYNVAGEVYVVPRLSPLAKYSAVWWELSDYPCDADPCDAHTCDADHENIEKGKDMTRTPSDELLAQLQYMDGNAENAVVAEWMRDDKGTEVEYGEWAHFEIENITVENIETLTVDDVFGEVCV